MNTVDYSGCDVDYFPKAGRHKLSLLDYCYTERGDKSDWDALCELHYKGHSLAAGSSFMRCVYAPPDDEPQLIGVLVFASPMPLNKGRHMVFPHLKPNQNGRDTKAMNQHRMRQINKSIKWTNRLVIDTMFRSGGIAYRFVNLAHRIYCTHGGQKFIEGNSSMGRFNPFTLKAGSYMAKPMPANALDVGIEFFRANFVSHPCDQVAVLQELAAMPEGVRNVIERKLREFYQKNSAMEQSGDKMHSGMTRVNKMPIEYILKQTVQIVFSSTLYFFWVNPDHGRDKATYPKRLPLLAFDNQGNREPLSFEKLKGMNNVC